VFAGNEQRTLMKLVVDQGTDRVLGVHIAGQDAPEMIQLAAIAVKAGLTKAQWDDACAVHPTAAEELVFGRTRRARQRSSGVIHKRRCAARLTRIHQKLTVPGRPSGFRISVI